MIKKIPNEGERSVEEIVLFVMFALLASLFITGLFNDFLEMSGFFASQDKIVNEEEEDDGNAEPDQPIESTSFRHSGAMKITPEELVKYTECRRSWQREESLKDIKHALKNNRPRICTARSEYKRRRFNADTSLYMYDESDDTIQTETQLTVDSSFEDSDIYSYAPSYDRIYNFRKLRPIRRHPKPNDMKYRHGIGFMNLAYDPDEVNDNDPLKINEFPMASLTPESAKKVTKSYSSLI